MVERVFPLRLAVGLGHLDRERALLSALCDGGDFTLAARCLAADDLVEQVRPGLVDVVLVATDLHRLTDDTLHGLRLSRVPLILLTDRPGDGSELGRTVLPLTANAVAVRAALLAAAGTPTPRPATLPDAPVAPAVGTEASDPEPAPERSILAVWSGPGERWRTRIAVELAAGLGAVDDTIIVDADLCGPSVHALLDADPTCSLVTLLHTDPRTPREWERAIEAEAQALHPRSRHGQVLCGVSKPEARGSISPPAMERLLDALAARYRHVVLDVGAEVLGDIVPRSGGILAGQGGLVPPARGGDQPAG